METPNPQPSASDQELSHRTRWPWVLTIGTLADASYLQYLNFL
jgi:hypothetical protein